MLLLQAAGCTVSKVGTDSHRGKVDCSEEHQLQSQWAVQGAHRKALDVLNSLGLSDGLLRVIDRRQRMDRVITYGGMVRHTLGYALPVTAAPCTQH